LIKARLRLCGISYWGIRSAWLMNKAGLACKMESILNAAEAAGFEVFITTDKNLRYQQNLSHRKTALVVLSATSWPTVQKITQSIARALEASKPNDYVEIEVPW
jgi:hypothetical protein